MRTLQKVFAGVGLTLVSMGVGAAALAPIQPVPYVDLSRFMGRWYVIAAIPTRFEREAYNAVETYTLQPDGKVYTAFRFNKGGFDAEEKRIHSLGIVKPDTGNAVWGVQVFWPLQAQYIVAYLSKDYGQTIVARDARDYAWIMSRTPSVSPEVYRSLMQKVQALGYDISKVRRVPQRWPAENDSHAGQ